MPIEEPVEGGFAPFEDEADHEREEAHQEQEQNDNHKRQRRGEVAGQLAFGNGLNIRPGFHRVASLAVSGRVMVRKTSSSRPSSVCNSSIFQPSFIVISATLRASSPLRLEMCG